MPKKPKKVKLTKAQKALKKLEAKRQLRRDLLQREVEHGELNWKMLQKKWRAMLIRMRLPEFRQHAETVWHKFENAVDLKNYMLSFVLDEIDEAEMQYNVNLQAHVEAVDKLIEFFGVRLDELRDDYKSKLDDLEQTARASAEHYNAVQSEDEMYIKAMLFIMEQNQAASDTSAKITYLSTTDEEKNKYADLRQILRSTLERQMELQWLQMKGVLSNYYSSTDERRKIYAEFKARDDQNIATVSAQLLKTEKLYSGIKKSREQLLFEKDNQNQALSDYVYERQYFADTYTALRDRLRKERAHDQNQLTLLTVESNESMKHMVKIAEKGERILSLAAICRKLETQVEKVTPFPKFSDDDVEETDENKTSDNDNILGMADDFDDMRFFWRRVGTADSKRVVLNECITRLNAENQYLCTVLGQYLDSAAETRARRPPSKSPRRGPPNHIADASQSIRHMLP